jgi:hypothetical protein
VTATRREERGRLFIRHTLGERSEGSGWTPKGLPDDRCQCPHRGYVFKGKMTARYADRDAVFEAGDAVYIPPGHIPVENEPGTQILWFSPTEELRTAEAVMMKNMQAMQGGSTT